MTPTLGHYLAVSGLLFIIGLAGVILRRNIIIIFMCLELMLNAANLSLVAFSRFNVNVAACRTITDRCWSFCNHGYAAKRRRIMIIVASFAPNGPFTSKI
jgi:hypothetical protein